MNNNLYQWHDERMVDFEMRQIRHELEQANLFRDARENWLARAVTSLFSLFTKRKDTVQADHSVDQRSHSSRRYKAAP